MKGLERHYSAYFESEDGDLWRATDLSPSLEGAKGDAFEHLETRQLGAFEDYYPTRLLIFECTQVAVYVPPEPAVVWRKIDGTD